MFRRLTKKSSKKDTPVDAEAAPAVDQPQQTPVAPVVEEETPSASEPRTLQDDLNSTDRELDPTTGAHPAVLDDAPVESSSSPSAPIVAPIDNSTSTEHNNTHADKAHDVASSPVVRVDDTPVAVNDGGVKDDGMMKGFAPVPVSPSGGDKTEHSVPEGAATASETNVNGVPNDGMQNNFVAVPSPTAPSHPSSHPEESQEAETAPAAGGGDEPVSPESKERFPSEDEKLKLAAAGAVGAGAGAAGLAGIGAFSSGSPHGETATFDHALPPTGLPASQVDQLKAQEFGAGETGLARGGVAGGSLSRKDLKKIEKAEHKDNKSLAKIMKAEAKHEAAVLEAAIKELARLQATVKDAAKLEAKSARARDETTKVEQKAKARLLEVKAVHDKAEAELRAKEEEHAYNQKQCELHTQAVADQTRKIDELRSNKARDDRERAEKLAAMK